MSIQFKIEEFAGGAIGERVNAAIMQVYENIADPNMEADKARKLTIELTFKPKKSDRTDVDVTAIVKTSLQPQRAINSRMIVESDGNGGVQGAEWRRGAMKGQMEIPLGEMRSISSAKGQSPSMAEEETTETQGNNNGVIDLQAQKRKAE